MTWPWKRRAKHRHDWRVIGYGGAGWHVIACTCGARDIT